MNKVVLILVKEILTEKDKKRLRSMYTSGAVVAPKVLEDDIKTLGYEWVPLEDFVQIENIYKASTFLEELSLLTLPDGARIAKSFMYEGYELWWIHYNDLFLNYCLPYTKYQPLLEYLKNFQVVYYFEPLYVDLFRSFLTAYGSKFIVIEKSRFSLSKWLPVGIFFQVIITIISLPILLLFRRDTLIFTGDKFDGLHDFDFRMRYVYEELRQRGIPFVEFVRSLQPWSVVLKHALKRKRPVIYSVAVSYIAQYLSVLSGGRYRSEQRYAFNNFIFSKNSLEKFKYTVATQYLLRVSDDIWAIRIMRFILSLLRIKVAFIPAANERNFHTVLGCKLNEIPTVGILHGVATVQICAYDFIPTYDGEKTLTVDTYGLWSEWWKQYYLKNGKAYKPEQLHVSGPMRPLSYGEESDILSSRVLEEKTQVLFVSEGVAVPQEVIPYLNELIAQKDIQVTIKFRPYRDEFEKWLLENAPHILKEPNVSVSREGVQDAIKRADVVTGCYSTAVLEAFIQLKVPLFFQTEKWGDYYNFRLYDEQHTFFAENPKELIAKIFAHKNISRDTLSELRERYFGDPYKNGSAWVVDELVARARIR